MEDIITSDYYNKNQIIYNLFWDRGCCNYGFWYKDTKSLAEAHHNTNDEIARKLNITTGDYVLDAGCGAGKTSSYLALKYTANFF